jgi:hypothetical protein
MDQLERDLVEIYKYEPEVLASDRDIFSTPICELMTLPPGEIAKWIASCKPIILYSRRDARQRSTKSVRLLPTYFHPLRKRPIARPRPRRRFSDPSHESPSSSYAYNDTTDTLITEHFTRQPTIRKPRRGLTSPNQPPSPSPSAATPSRPRPYPR